MAAFLACSDSAGDLVTCAGDVVPTVMQDPQYMIQALKDHWSPIFADKAIDHPAVERYLDEVMPPLSEQSLPLPTVEDLVRVARQMGPSAVGPDMLPYRALLFSEGSFADAVYLEERPAFFG